MLMFWHLPVQLVHVAVEVVGRYFQHPADALQGEPLEQEKPDEPFLRWTHNLILPLKDKLPGAVLILASSFAVVGSPDFDYTHAAAVVT